ncbi:hypothetical protein [Methanobacterium spitsbergense]|uniref:Uncharacterized protein n=1 Tax=Methanobacterium spitsbergense TaxID=2874285 RepID=A0A8T5V1Q5_9EURY|nr:hypothetical protein [Methanobacterium spitsbergense]MBZ2166983.1 hypothetical protein [Methanobacterium spitsbergense]
METKAEDQEIEIARYGYIECSSMEELIQQMNLKDLEGYSPVWPSHKPLLFDKDSYFMIVEYHEPIDPEEKKDIKAQLSQLIMDAEFQVATVNAKLEDKKTDLNANTDWKKASETQVNPIKTVGDKAGYVAKQTKELQAKVDSYKSYLSHLKRLEKLGILPESDAPWIKPKTEDKVIYPMNALDMSGNYYCGDDMKKKCELCRKCEEIGE